MLFTLPAVALLSGLHAVSAQSSSISFSEIVTPLWPTGVSEGSTGAESTLPLACLQGCFPVTSPYLYVFPLFVTRILIDSRDSACFLNVSESNGGLSPENQGSCDDFYCSQGNYTQLLNCANCIVANGDERPFGYASDSELTAAPTQTGVGSPITNPLGLIDMGQLNGWLANVTERCSSINRPLSGASTVTASPTTT